MKLIMGCFECAEQYGLGDDTVFFVEIEDGSYYQCTCPRGHSRNVILTTSKFEILFEFGAMALLDGYPREAVSSFAVALERFYEFWVKAHLLHGDVDPQQVDAAWNQVSAQSERQLGAYALLYLREYGTPAPLLPQSETEFRNKVIHKGYIPSRKEVEQYGEQVIQHMAELFKELQKSRASGLSKLHRVELGQAVSRSPQSNTPSTMAIATVFSEVAGKTGSTFRQALQHLQDRMTRMYKK